MNLIEHVAQAEMLLKEAREFPARPIEEEQVLVTAAVAHGVLALVLKNVHPGLPETF